MRIGDSTFHASRQQRSVGRLRTWLQPGQPAQIACAAGLGVLRGVKLVERGNVAIDTLMARELSVEPLKPIAKAGLVSCALRKWSIPLARSYPSQRAAPSDEQS